MQHIFFNKSTSFVKNTRSIQVLYSVRNKHMMPYLSKVTLHLTINTDILEPVFFPAVKAGKKYFPAPKLAVVRHDNSRNFVVGLKEASLVF